MSFADFSHKPETAHNFRHVLGIVKGTIWAFDANGEPVSHGGPIGIIKNSNTYYIEVTPRIFDFPDGASVSGSNPLQVAELIEAANTFCRQTGYVRDRGSAGILSTQTANLIVRHCLPEGVTIPTDGKAGDDVQRNPFSRLLGIPPLRGRAFFARYGRPEPQ